MRKIFISILLIISCITLVACSHNNNVNVTTVTETTAKESNMYTQISQEQAKSIIDSKDDKIILDVRTESEFEEGHIPNAVLLPDYDITDKAESILPDKDALILVYCRSGNRSKKAAAELASMGYTNIKEFGGIIDWQYETTK